jgi:hypothetical protein
MFQNYLIIRYGDVLKWPKYYSISQVKIVVMAKFTQASISLEPCLGMEYQKGPYFYHILVSGNISLA